MKKNINSGNYQMKVIQVNPDFFRLRLVEINPLEENIVFETIGSSIPSTTELINRYMDLNAGRKDLIMS